MRKVDSWSPLAPGYPCGGMQGGCALAGLRALLTSQLPGCVTACLAAVTGRVPACRPPPAPDGLPVNWGGARETRLRVPGWALSSHPSSESGCGQLPATSSDKQGPGCGLHVWTFYFKIFPPRKEGQKKAAHNWAWASDACQRRGWWRPGGEAAVSTSVFHGARKGAFVLSQGPPWAGGQLPWMECVGAAWRLWLCLGWGAIRPRKRLLSGPDGRL